MPVYETSSAEQVRVDPQRLRPWWAASWRPRPTRRWWSPSRDRLPQLKHVWQIDAGAVETLASAGSDVSDGQVVERSSIADADSPATIVYTSGTTGRPKGCVLTHRSFFAECGNVVDRLTPLFRTGRVLGAALPAAGARLRAAGGGRRA